jgi:hypothetical protein
MEDKLYYWHELKKMIACEIDSALADYAEELVQENDMTPVLFSGLMTGAVALSRRMKDKINGGEAPKDDNG